MNKKIVFGLGILLSSIELNSALADGSPPGGEPDDNPPAAVPAPMLPVQAAPVQAVPPPAPVQVQANNPHQRLPGEPTRVRRVPLFQGG